MPVDYDFYSEFMRPAIGMAGILNQAQELGVQRDRTAAYVAEANARQKIEQQKLDQAMRTEQAWNTFQTALGQSVARNQERFTKADFDEFYNQPGHSYLVYKPTPDKELQIQQKALDAALNETTPLLPAGQIPGVLNAIENRASRELLARQAIEAKKEHDDRVFNAKATELHARYGDLSAEEHLLLDQQLRAIGRQKLLSPDEQQALMEETAAKFMKGRVIAPKPVAKPFDALDREVEAARVAGEEYGHVVRSGTKLTLKPWHWYNPFTWTDPPLEDIRKRFNPDAELPVIGEDPEDEAKYKALKSGDMYRDKKGRVLKKL